MKIIFGILLAIIFITLLHPVDAAPPVKSGTPSTATGTSASLIISDHVVPDGTNRALLVNVGIKDTSSPQATVSSIKWTASADCTTSAQSLTLISAATTTFVGTKDVRSDRLETWYLVNPTVRTGNICITASDGTFNRITAGATNFVFVDPAIPISNPGTNTGSDGTGSTHFINANPTSKYGDLIFASVLNADGGIFCQQLSECTKFTEVYVNRIGSGNSDQRVGLLGGMYNSQSGTTSIIQKINGATDWIISFFAISQDSTPYPPTIATVSGDTQVILSWTTPISLGSPITDYVLQYRISSTPTWTTISDGTNTNTSYTLTGLTNGATYFFQVAAVNVLQGPFSAAVSAIPAVPTVNAPTVPLNFIGNAGNTSVFLSWSAPANSGSTAITDYIVERSVDGVTWTVFSDGISTATSTTVTGLTTNQLYYFQVKAKNTSLFSPYATITSTTIPFPTPSAPVSLLPTSGNTLVSLSWTVPASDGGSTITDYIVEHSVDGVTWTVFSDGISTATSTTVTGLVNDSLYYFRVSALTVNGQGLSSITTSTPSAVAPSQVTGLSATAASSTQIDLSWSAPSNGGSAITGYKIERESPVSGGWSTIVATTGTTATTYSNTSLVTNTQYNYRVSAINLIGTGTASAASNATTAAVAPSQVTGLSATGGNTLVTLNWS